MSKAPVFLSIAVTAGVTNFFSAITPQGSSANVLFTGNGYLQSREVYGYGGMVTLICTLIFLTIGSAWIWLLGA
ncbi:MAG: anion permease [Pseudomonadota bacterium]